MATSVSNRPKPPDTFCKALIEASAVLPTRKERVYSSSWNSGIGLWGGFTCTICPFFTSQPLDMRMVALTAMTWRPEHMVPHTTR